MQKKSSNLFVFDLDGTLVHSDSTGRRLVPPQLRDVLIELAATAQIIIATGRRMRTAQHILEQLPPIPYMVCHNGLIVAVPPTEVVEAQRMSFSTAVKIIDCLAKQSLVGVMVLDGQDSELDFVCLSENLSSDYRLQEVKKKAPSNLKDIAEWADLESNFQSQVLEVAAVAPYADLKLVQDRLAGELPEGFRSLVVRNAGYSGMSVMEVFPSHISKWTGVEYVAERLGVDKIIAIGDDENDVEMIQQAHIGVAMSHAQDEVLAVSQIQVDGPDGLATYLKKEWIA